jgi:N-acetylneuraminic acid mutarotase
MFRPILCFTSLASGLIMLGACNDSTEPTSEAAAVPGSSDVTAVSADPNLAVAVNSWATRADMPSTARFSLTTAVVENPAGESVLYAMGGASASGGSLSRVQAYNVATNTWTYRAPLPVPMYSTNGAGVINGKIYISGGVSGDKNYRKELYVYDPATNRWTRKQDPPNSQWGGVTGVLNNALYVLTCEGEEDCLADRFTARLTLYRYDPAADQWVFLSVTPFGIGPQAMGGFIGGKLYVTGPSGVLGAYDPATNQWTTKAPPPDERWAGAGVTVGAKLYIIGGKHRASDGSFKDVRTTLVYDPASNSWTTKAPMPTLRTGIAGSRVFVNGQPRIEIVGGPRPGNNLQYTP